MSEVAEETGTIIVTRDEQGQLVGYTEQDERRFRAFNRSLEALQWGDFFTFDYWFPRDRQTHRRHFKMLSTLNQRQEQFASLVDLRMWLQVGAGHCYFVPGLDGTPIAIPRSINFRTIDEMQFREHHEAVKVFMRSSRCQEFLWPHLSLLARAAFMEDIIAPFERANRR